MTREEARKKAEVMMAYAEGKNIEFRIKGDEKWERWIVTYNLEFNFDEYDYRIKKEPTYRPFKDTKECWNEMQKHQPFGWAKAREALRQVLTIGSNYVCFASITLDYNEAFEEVKFADGTPFGIKEERK